MKVSFPIPAYNEGGTIERVVDRIQELPFDKQVIVVDDGSTDETRELLARLALAHANLVVIRQASLGIEPEITGRICRQRLRIYEVPIAYYGRTYAEGKKITWRDGFRALWVLIRVRVS